MNRKHFIQTSGLSLAALLINDSIFAGNSSTGISLMNLPDAVSAVINGVSFTLTGKGKQVWTYQNLLVSLKNTGNSIAIAIQAPGIKLSSVTLHWKTPVKKTSHILNDHWERTYEVPSSFDNDWHGRSDAVIGRRLCPRRSSRLASRRSARSRAGGPRKPRSRRSRLTSAASI